MKHRQAWILGAALCGMIGVFLPWSLGSGSNAANGLSYSVWPLGIFYLAVFIVVALLALLSIQQPGRTRILNNVIVLLSFLAAILSLSVLLIGITATGRYIIGFIGQYAMLGIGWYFLTTASLACLFLPFLEDKPVLQLPPLPNRQKGDR